MKFKIGNYYSFIDKTYDYFMSPMKAMYLGQRSGDDDTHVVTNIENGNMWVYGHELVPLH